MTGFVNEVIRDFFFQNLDYYLESAELDARGRGYRKGCKGKYYTDLIALNLRPWKNDIRPNFLDSPLKEIADAGEARKNQHRLKQIRVSEYQVGLLRLAMKVDALTLIQVTSRIVTWHLKTYWDVRGGYQWQRRGSEQRTLRPKI